MSDPSALPPAVRRYVHGFVVRGRRLAVLRGAGLAVAAFLGAATIWCVADRYLQFDAWVRLIGLLSCSGLGALLLVRPFARVYRKQTDWVEAAVRIEEQDPRFGQRLVTVISRLLGRPEHRGSDEILEHLVYQLDQEAAEQNSARLLPSGPAWRPWICAAVLAAVVGGLTRISDLRFTTLARRFVAPLADIAPVTTTRLEIAPGDIDLKQGQSLQIEVSTDRLGGGQVWAHVSGDGGRTWSRAAMTPATDSRFTHTVVSVDRDLFYYVTGGDAVSPRHVVRVLRRPAVAEFEIRYVFPASTGKPPLTVINTDGLIEAPVGTEATITIRATEPLQSAMFTFAGEKTLMARASRDEERQCRLTVMKDGRFELDLISTREQTGSGPSTTQIRAVPDRPAVVRVVEPGDGIRLSPRDIVPMAYEAFDDYGLEAVGLRAQVGIAPAVDVPIEAISEDRAAGPEQPRADPTPLRRKQGVFHLDLGTLPLTVGDVVTLTITARDSAGSLSLSEPVHVLVSPRSIDLDAYERMAELDAAAHLADTVYDELEAARKALSEAGAADKPAEQSATALARMNRRITSAQESSAAMRRALLRATAHADSAALATALAGWVDVIQTQSVSLQSMHRQARNQRTAEWIGQTLDAVRTLREELRVVSSGLRAEAIQADRENLAAAAKRPTPQDYKTAELLRRTLQRTRDEVTAGITRLGLKPDTGDLDAQLKLKVDAARSLVAGRQPVDFAGAARDWSQRMQNEPARPGALEDRLAAAAQAEAIRPDAEPSRARDLQLAARAVDVLSAEAALSAMKGPDGKRLRPAVSPATFNQFASAVAAVQREQDLVRASRQNPHRADEMAHVAAAANEARNVLTRMIGEADPLAVLATPSTTQGNGPLPVGRPGQSLAGSRAARAEALALAAGAEAVNRNYSRTGELDAALVRQVRTIAAVPGAAAATNPTDVQATVAQLPEIDRAQQAIARSTAGAQAADIAAERQDKLAQETAALAASPDDAAAPSLAARQGELAGQIAEAAARFNPVSPGGTLSLAGAEEANWRERGVTTLVGTQAQLAMLPAQIAKLQESQSQRRDAARRANEARRQVDNAPPDQKTAIQRAAAQAKADEKEAAARLDEAARPIAEVADAMTSWLDPFAPEATAGRDIVAQRLTPALKALVQSSKIADPGAADRAAADARQAIDAAQRELSRAQEAMADRDPMVAAKSYSRAAAEALLRKPPDFQGAERHQRATARLLNRVWDMSLRRASAQRLAIVPALKPVLTLVPPPDARGPESGKPATAARDWRRLRPREQDSTNAMLREIAPPEYDAALDQYFKMLNRGREK